MFLVSIIDFYFLNKKKCLARAAHMNTQLKKAVILAPFWNQPGCVGKYGLNSFGQWLDERIKTGDANDRKN